MEKYVSLSDFLKSCNYEMKEGYSQQVPDQVKDLIEFSKSPNMRIMEIGFNAGHSAEIFLKHNPTATLLSFDLGAHPYVRSAKEYIDGTFPDRHTLILGDSRTTLPEYIQTHQGAAAKFDLIFIDGGHDLPIAKSDIENCYHFAHANSVVIMDDTIRTKYWDATWTRGPTRAWNEAIQKKMIVESGWRDYTRGRGISWGKYVL